MPRRKRIKGGFVRKKKSKEPVVEELIFSVVATNEGMENAWIEGMYPSFEEAKDMVDNFVRKILTYTSIPKIIEFYTPKKE